MLLYTILSGLALIGSAIMLLVCLYAIYLKHQEQPYYIRDTRYNWLIGQYTTKEAAVEYINSLVYCGNSRKRYSLTRYK